ncbi:MAG: FAD-binding oxidoreductase, partial [Sutterellaceae bacterium]|nr:FAD-binding oxidoreductase [Sutterellaceae bacterium]
MSLENDFLLRLVDIVGADHVKTDVRDFAPKLTDNRKRYHGHVTCAVFPATTEEVSRVLTLAHEFGAYVFAQGGNTSNVAGATPVYADQTHLSLLLSTDRMRRIEKIDAVNDTAVVQAGVIVEDLQNAAKEKNRLFAVSLAAQGSCTVGGILATNAGGVHVLYYGNSREQCLGLEVVLYDGRVLNLMRGLRKDNTGYDLKDLLVGSEGTLGVITRAVVKLWPRPVRRVVTFVSIDNTQGLPKVFNALHEALSSNLTAFEV